MEVAIAGVMLLGVVVVLLATTGIAAAVLGAATMAIAITLRTLWLPSSITWTDYERQTAGWLVIGSGVLALVFIGLRVGHIRVSAIGYVAAAAAVVSALVPMRAGLRQRPDG